VFGGQFEQQEIDMNVFSTETHIRQSNSPSGNNYLLSIVIPVYNVEKYIRACLESVFHQDIDERVIEVLIINDGTTDKSMEMIDDIVRSHSNIIVINQKNQGPSVARNNGIAHARGEYILMIDSDDLLIDNSLSVLLEQAVSSKADLVVADYLEMKDEEIEESTTINQKAFHVIEKTGCQLFLEDLNPHQCYVWRTLFRREFLMRHHLRFIPGIYFEDVPFTHWCYLVANKCLRVSWLLNIYRRRQNSITLSFDKKKAYDMCIAIAETWKLSYLTQNKQDVLNKLHDDVFISIKVLLHLVSYDINKADDRKEIILFLRQQAPDLEFYNGLKQIVNTKLYRFSPILFINIHYYSRRIQRYFFRLFAIKVP
jgi:glycosyltransferase involved in cell wall biosynthesis